MIDDILKDIREAEDKADEIIRLANQKGKEIVAKAETDAQAQKRATLKECKDDRKKALDLANEQARKKREDILKKGQAAADAIVEEKKQAANEQADALTQQLLAKYCSKSEQ